MIVRTLPALESAQVRLVRATSLASDLAAMPTSSSLCDAIADALLVSVRALSDLAVAQAIADADVLPLGYARLARDMERARASIARQAG